LEYADFSDFLLAAVREPVVILLTVVSAFVILVLHEINYRARIRFAAYDRLCRSRWGRTGVGTMYMSPRTTAIATIVLYFGAVFTPIYAEYRADRIKNGQTRPATVRLDNAGASEPATRTLPIVGTTSRFVFLYDAKTKRTYIVPFDNVAEITVTRRPRPH